MSTSHPNVNFLGRRYEHTEDRLLRGQLELGLGYQGPFVSDDTPLHYCDVRGGFGEQKVRVTSRSGRFGSDDLSMNVGYRRIRTSREY